VIHQQPIGDSAGPDDLTPAPYVEEASGYGVPGGNFEYTPAGPARPGGWTFIDVALLLVIALPAQLVAVAICMGSFHFYEWLTGVESTFPASLADAPMVVAVQIVWWSLLIAFIYGVVTIRHGLPFLPAIGFRSVNRPPGAYLLGGILLAVSVAVMAYVLPEASGRMPIQDLIDDRDALLVLAFYGVLFAPVVEEIVFRGFLYAVIERAKGPLLAVLVTSIVFSLPHAWQYGWRWQNVLLVTYVGVMFGIARARTGSIVPSTLLHVGYNGTLFAGLFAAGDKLFTP
jgi:membrane protease YdiL (CAAX protease family)